MSRKIGAFAATIPLIVAVGLGPQVRGQDSVGEDTVSNEPVVRANYQDASAYKDLPEKPLWFFLDSLEQISLQPVDSIKGKPKYQVSTSETPIGLMAGFEVSRVDYTINFQNTSPPTMQQGMLLLMNIWPGLYKLVAAYKGSDAPDSSSIVFLNGQDCLGNFWYCDDGVAIDWAQYWTWDWPTEAPKNLRFMAVSSAALDATLPPGYYARYAGLMVNDSLCLTAPVYKPIDDFGKPTGGEVKVGYRIENNMLVATYCTYTKPKPVDK